MLAWSETVASGPAVKDAMMWPLGDRVERHPSGLLEGIVCRVRDRRTQAFV